jgi:regulator of protease activity HflC (stomatin/prohibitin superfamily)
MSLFLLGVLIALALLVFGQNLPAIQLYPRIRYFVAAVVVALALLFSMVKVIPPGNVGVLVFMGKVYGTIAEGIHLINPLSSVELMSVRTQEVFEHAEAPSREGLNVVLEVSCLYHLMPDQADRVYRQLGPHYDEVVVKPQFRAAIRGATVKHEAKDLYTSGRELVSNEIYKDLEESLGQRGVMVENILLRKIDLPKQVVEAINAKLAADQEAQRMQFILIKEKQEAERKRIEAQGIQDFQKIVSQSISDQLLRWKGIEATSHLAESTNTKIIIVGGKDGLPVILNTETGGAVGK